MCSAMSRELVLTTLQCHAPQDLLELRNNECQKNQCKNRLIIFNQYPTSIKSITKIRHKRCIEAEQRRHGGDLLGQRHWLKLWGLTRRNACLASSWSNGTRSCLTWPLRLLEAEAISHLQKRIGSCNPSCADTEPLSLEHPSQFENNFRVGFPSMPRKKTSFNITRSRTLAPSPLLSACLWRLGDCDTGWVQCFSRLHLFGESVLAKEVQFRKALHPTCVNLVSLCRIWGIMMDIPSRVHCFGW